jgi:hypothetical protein
MTASPAQFGISTQSLSIAAMNKEKKRITSRGAYVLRKSPKRGLEILPITVVVFDHEIQTADIELFRGQHLSSNLEIRNESEQKQIAVLHTNFRLFQFFTSLDKSYFLCIFPLRF